MNLSDENIRYATQFLLEHGAIASIKDKSGHTALDYAKIRSRRNGSSSISVSKSDAESIRLMEAAIKREQRSNNASP
jgi:hypothetical protein